jgi:acyl-CoA thioester hydrolase
VRVWEYGSSYRQLYKMFITETFIRVRYAETDQMNVVYYGNYAQYFEVARAESIRNLGLTYKEIEAFGVIMPVVEMQIKYLRPAHYDDLLTIKTILRELTTDHRIIFEHEVYNAEKKLLTQGKVILYFVKMGSFEKTTMPETMRRILLPFFPEKI